MQKDTYVLSAMTHFPYHTTHHKDNHF